MNSPFAPSGPHAPVSSQNIQFDLFERKRYNYFRPWFSEARVVDAGSGEGVGTDMIAMVADQVTGLDSDAEAVARARDAFPAARFRGGDAANFEYAKADVVVAFDLLPFVKEPVRVLQAMAACHGALAISVPNPAFVPKEAEAGRRHAWGQSEFQRLIAEAFPARQVQWLSQAPVFPGDFSEGLDEGALYWFALVGDRAAPEWPSIGNTMPCYNNAAMARMSVYANLGGYPGRMGYGLVANGCTDDERSILEELAAEFPDHIRFSVEQVNIGGGSGWNKAVEMVADAGFDVYGTCGDDVFPSPNCWPEMVWVWQSLRAEGLRPGMIAPMSNSVSGRQQVEVGKIGSYDDVLALAPAYERRHLRTATPMLRLMPLMSLMTREVVEELGAFDPRFGFGTCGDDDFNVRMKLGGFSAWSADGAFAFHAGSVAFRRAGVDMTADQKRGVRTLLAKYGCAKYEDVYALQTVPDGVSLYIPLGARRTAQDSYEVPLDGRAIDLVLEATDEEFAAWVAIEMARRPREERWKVLEAMGVRRAA